MGHPGQNETSFDSPAFELSAHQASLAFERTLMSADRTLMAAVQTSLSLIGFGFAMFLFFNQMGGEVGIDLRAPARNFGIGLVTMGVGLVTAGLVEHRRRFSELRIAMNDLHRQGLLVQGFRHRKSPTAAFAVLLLLLGLLVMLGIVVRIGPLG